MYENYRKFLVCNRGVREYNRKVQMEKLADFGKRKR